MTKDDGFASPVVKICGLTNLMDAQVAVDAGADYLGFIFVQRSPRHVTPYNAREIVARLDRTRKRPLLVGVFVNATEEEIAWTLSTCQLDLAQLHGEEPPEMLTALSGRAFKALRPRSIEKARQQAARYGSFGPVDGPDLLVDAFHPSVHGGTGHTGDWDLAADLSPTCRLLLAGGLKTSNVASAIDQVRPWGVDVASGVEKSPGRKDHASVRGFIAAVKHAAG
ncbi:MAG: phosphoribosylanthranilate isomerase [Chloroflexota bacterium]|nr:phosphoribosylanthranilate isomerase [Chloroflexota bacterium]